MMDKSNIIWESWSTIIHMFEVGYFLHFHVTSLMIFYVILVSYQCHGYYIERVLNLIWELLIFQLTGPVIVSVGAPFTRVMCNTPTHVPGTWPTSCLSLCSYLVSCLFCPW
jgi:hypothetical protein